MTDVAEKPMSELQFTKAVEYFEGRIADALASGNLERTDHYVKVKSQLYAKYLNG